ncbi:MAG: PEGA domain-containing protein [Burkholderiales bacterium]
MLRLPAVIAFAAAAALLGGCASDSALVYGPMEQLKVESDPAGAAVRLSTGATGTTPVRFSIPRKADIGIVISKEGYETTELQLHPVMHGWAKAGLAMSVLNPRLLLPVAVPTAVSSASSYTHRPNPVRVKLKPLAPSGSESAKPAAGKTPPPIPDGRDP